MFKELDATTRAALLEQVKTFPEITEAQWQGDDLHLKTQPLYYLATSLPSLYEQYLNLGPITIVIREEQTRGLYGSTHHRVEYHRELQAEMHECYRESPAPHIYKPSLYCAADYEGAWKEAIRSNDWGLLVALAIEFLYSYNPQYAYYAQHFPGFEVSEEEAKGSGFRIAMPASDELWDYDDDGDYYDDHDEYDDYEDEEMGEDLPLKEVLVA